MSVLFSCKKDKVTHEFVPALEFKSITPDPVTEYGPVYITVKYIDGNGDLGENEANVKNLFVKDNRIGITYEYRVNQLAPDNSSLPISGNLEIKIDNAVITNGGSEQAVNYSIYIVDKAGNKSNTVTTSTVTIKQ